MGFTKQGHQESTEGKELIFRIKISAGSQIQPTVKFLRNCLRLVRMLLFQFYCAHWDRKSMSDTWSVVVHMSDTGIVLTIKHISTFKNKFGYYN